MSIQEFITKRQQKVEAAFNGDSLETLMDLYADDVDFSDFSKQLFF